VFTLFLVISPAGIIGLQKENNNSSLEMMLHIACECSVMHEQHDDWFSALTVLANEHDNVECLNTDIIIDRFSLTSQKLQKHLK
jgi:hypothetical protein